MNIFNFLNYENKRIFEKYSMVLSIRKKISAFLRWSERYTKTDMHYASKGVFWILLGKAGVFLVSLITMTAFANWLSKETYGTYQLIISLLGIAGIFALSGMSTSLIRSIAQKKEGTLLAAVKEKIKWGSLGSLGLLLVALWYFFHHNLVLAGGFAIGAIFLPFRETFAITPVFWNGRKRFDLEGLYKVLPAILALCIIIPVIYFTDNVLWILFATLGSYVLFDGLFLLRTIRKTDNSDEDKEAITFGKTLTAMDAMVRIAGNIDKIILWKFLGPVQVAIYSFAQFPMKALGGALPIQSLALTKLGEKNIKDIKQGLLRKFFYLFFLSVPLTIFIIFLTPFVYKAFFPQYSESVIYFQALTIILIFMPFDLLGAALISDRRKKELFIVRVGTSVLRIILFFAHTPAFGIWGVIGALLLAEVVRVGMIFFFFQRI